MVLRALVAGVVSEGGYVPRDLTPPVEDFNGRGECWLRSGRLSDFSKVSSLFEHAKGGAESQVANDVKGEVIEPVQRVHLVPTSLLRGGARVPLLLQLFKVVVDVLLELADRLCRKGVRDGLALTCVLGAIARVEEAAADRDKGVVVLALEEAIAVAVDLRNGICVGNTDVVWLDANQDAVLLVRLVDGQVALPLARLPEQPEVRPRSREGCGDVADAPIAEVWQQVIEDRKQEHRVRCEQHGQEHGGQMDGALLTCVVADVQDQLHLYISSPSSSSDMGT
jgi:hypothetical protein